MRLRCSIMALPPSCRACLAIQPSGQAALCIATHKAAPQPKYNLYRDFPWPGHAPVTIQTTSVTRPLSCHDTIDCIVTHPQPVKPLLLSRYNDCIVTYSISQATHARAAGRIAAQPALSGPLASRILACHCMLARLCRGQALPVSARLLRALFHNTVCCIVTLHS